MFIHCLYMEVESKIKRWGNSYGVLLSKELIENEMLKENETVVVNIHSKRKNLEKLFGLCKFKKSTKDIIKEIKEGYD